MESVDLDFEIILGQKIWDGTPLTFFFVRQVVVQCPVCWSAAAGADTFLMELLFYAHFLPEWGRFNDSDCSF